MRVRSRILFPILAVTLTGVALSGCSAQGPTQSTSAAAVASSSSVIAIACESPRVTLDSTKAPAWEFTAIRLRDAASFSNSSLGEALVDKTVTSSLTWDTDAAWVDDEQIRALISQKVTLPTNSTALANVDRFLESIQDSHTVLGYGALKIERLAIQVSCENGLTADGQIMTWNNNEIGAVTCGDPNSADKNTVAALAQKTYCP